MKKIYTFAMTDRDGELLEIKIISESLWAARMMARTIMENCPDYIDRDEGLRLNDEAPY